MPPFRFGDLALSETAAVVLSYATAYKSHGGEIIKDSMRHGLMAKFPLLEYLPSSQELIDDAIDELDALGVFDSTSFHEDPEVAAEVDAMASDYIRNNCDGILQRIPLGQICEIASSARADKNVEMLDERLGFCGKRRLADATPMSRQYVDALSELEGDDNLCKQQLVHTLADLAGIEPRDNPPIPEASETSVFVYHTESLVPNREIHLVFAVLNAEGDPDAQFEAVDRLVAKYKSDNLVFVTIGRCDDFSDRAIAHLRGRRGVVLFEHDLKAIALSQRPEEEFGRQVLLQLPPSTVSPFRFTGPVTGSIFFGREREIRRIFQTTQACYCILGSRQIGKTSLLQTLWNKVNVEGALANTVAVYVDATSDRYLRWFQKNIMQELLRETEGTGVDLGWIEPGETFFEELRSALKKSGKRYLLLIDEIDSLVRHDNTSLLEGFVRSMSNERYATFVFSGYRALRDRTNDRSSSFYNLFDTIVLKPLEREEAAALVREPMARIHVEFENDRVIESILNLGSTFPSHLQRMCHLLLKKLDERDGERTITLDDVTEVYEGDAFTSAITSSVREYSDQEFGLLERLIVYMAANRADPHFTERDIFEGLDKVLYSPRFSEVRTALNYLTSTYIFGRQSNGIYHFSLPILKRKLRETEADMDFVISALAREYRSD